MDLLQNLSKELKIKIVPSGKKEENRLARISANSRIIEYNDVLLNYSETFIVFVVYQLSFLAEHKDLKKADEEAVDKLITTYPNLDLWIFFDEFSKSLYLTLTPINVERVKNMKLHIEGLITIRNHS